MNMDQESERDRFDTAEEIHLAGLPAVEAEGDERAIEAALRPRSLDEVIGQGRLLRHPLKDCRDSLVLRDHHETRNRIPKIAI